MKKLIFTLITAGILFSCNNDDDSNPNTDLIGNWQLIEVLSDPGDGSGTFTSVESDKTITFKSGGIIASNGNLCDMGINSGNPTSGTYSTSKWTFNSPDCDNPEYDFTFEQNGNILIINYPCIEPCKVKYKKK
ncbi:lipocalin family protein [Gelidibacter pelagius]|uniref:Lipocalin-like domain-containing protein n=1 Tax=Gelidibacter pelagius TaxID=2819985 RepID=A0ABS3SMV5_9FLAO|nr:lipocalin family protein [Gelidibacter pelagius]MBO3097044.1 hypothetical protein [Gelidibacter pelagius]